MLTYITIFWGSVFPACSSLFFVAAVALVASASLSMFTVLLQVLLSWEVPYSQSELPCAGKHTLHDVQSAVAQP
eukprot:3627844-Amphidinium_carterae.2